MRPILTSITAIITLAGILTYVARPAPLTAGGPKVEPAEKPKQPTALQLFNQQLINLQQSKNVEERRAAASEVLQFAKNVESTLILLTHSARHDEDDRVREISAFAIANYGPRAYYSAFSIADALGHEKVPSVRIAYIIALSSMLYKECNPELVETIVPPIVKLLNSDPDSLVRLQAAICFRYTGLCGEKAAHSLYRIMMDEKEDEELRNEARKTLPMVAGPACADLTPLLIKHYQNGIKVHDIEASVLMTLGKIGSDEKNVLRILTAALANPGGREARTPAAIGLGSMGTKARSAVPALIQALDIKDDISSKLKFNIRSQLLRAIERIGPISRSDYASLQKLAKDSKTSYRMRDQVDIFLKYSKVENP